MIERRRYGMLTRREALIRAASLVGTAGVAAQIGACSREAATVAASDAPPLDFFTDEQFQTIARIADLIIPDTDTPGADAVGVPETLDAMMTNWASKETQEKWIGVLEAVDAKARDLHNAGFNALDADKQFETLRLFDQEALTRGNDDYRNVKDLVMVAYYSSEIGATQELRFELVPGAYRGCIPFSDVGRTWAQ